MGKTEEMDLEPLSSADLLNGDPEAEFITLVGKDGVGKTSAIVSMAKFVEEMFPDAAFWVIDSEDKFRAALRSYGDNAPQNLKYFHVRGMNQINHVVQQIVDNHNPWDWVAVESFARIWERAQDLAYKSIAGVTKVEYLDLEPGVKTSTGVVKKNAPIPAPDDFWNIAKGSFDRGFVDKLTQGIDLHVIGSSTITKPKDKPGTRENPDRKAVMAELGIDLGIDGPPRLPYTFKTLCLMELYKGKVSCNMLRDNLTVRDNGRVEFPVADKKAWADKFWRVCRMGEEIEEE